LSKAADELSGLLSIYKKQASRPTITTQGLAHRDRQQAESEFRCAHLDVLVATATLEMGINLPAKQVVLYDLQGFDGSDFVPLAVNSVWQRAGRAGRPGLDLAGEVVLLAPVWDRQAEQYTQGKFEAIASGLSQPLALAEQIIAEVASGLCRTTEQLKTVLGQTLATRQGRLPSIDRVVSEMLAAEMLIEREVNGHIQLQATKLAFIAVRNLIMPNTVLLFQAVLRFSPQLTFLDLLILAASSFDCHR
jgi:helicase